MLKIKILSRSSFLAKIQTQMAINAISNKNKKTKIEVVYSDTIGDQDMSPHAWEKHGFGIFTNSLSQQLVKKNVDLIVHSFKDLPVKNKLKTSFVALERDDPRDVLLIKKTSLKKKSLVIGTSSPRRAYYLKLLKNYVPYSSLKSKKIRGNIQTRLSKIVNNSSEDGVFMSKAAIDRAFLLGPKIDSTIFKQFKKDFKKFASVIMPLSQFPAAAAQGCIALEYRSNNKNLKKILEKINHHESYQNCIQERKFLANWGGGCSLDIGATIEQNVYRKILFSRGRDNKTNLYFHNKKYLEKINAKKVKNIFPNDLKKYQMFYRQPLVLKKILNKDVVIVSRANFINKNMFKKDSYIIASGDSTWKKLNKLGILVNASLDNFGEEYRLPNYIYTQSLQKPYKLTYQENKFESHFKKIPHYSISPSVNRDTIDNLFTAESFYWMSFSAFQLALKLRPEILNKINACGPGNTYKQISIIIPKEQLNVYLSYEDFRKNELKI